MKKMTKILAIALVAALGTRHAVAGDIEVTWNAFQFTGISLAGDNIVPVPQGNTIQIGFFTVAPTVDSPDLTNFVPWASDTINDGFDGFWLSNITQDEASTAGRQIYLVVTAPNNQLGIYTSTQWKFPVSTDLVPTTLIDLNDLVSNPGSVGNALAANAQVVFGSGPFFNSETNESFLKLAVIPEPSSFLLVGFGLLGLTALRRRR